MKRLKFFLLFVMVTALLLLVGMVLWQRADGTELASGKTLSRATSGIRELSAETAMLQSSVSEKHSEKSEQISLSTAFTSGSETESSSAVTSTALRGSTSTNSKISATKGTKTLGQNLLTGTTESSPSSTSASPLIPQNSESDKAPEISKTSESTSNDAKPKENKATDTDPSSGKKSDNIDLPALVRQFEPSVVSIQIFHRRNDGQELLISRSSGLIIREDGLILTTWSNLSGAFNSAGLRVSTALIRVLVYGRDEFSAAELISYNRESDLALLQIPLCEVKYKAAKLSANPGLEIGAELFCLGSSERNQAPELSLGVGFMTERGPLYFGENGQGMQYWTTNAFIPKSSSGGLIFNRKGEAIGLATAGLTRSAADRMGYFYPSNHLLRIVTQLSEKREKSHVWFGIAILDPNTFESLQKLYGYPAGLYIQNVYSNSPAYASNLMNGDIITQINGKNVRQLSQLQDALRAAKPGDSMDLVVIRSSSKEPERIRVFLSAYEG